MQESLSPPAGATSGIYNLPADGPALSDAPFEKEAMRTTTSAIAAPMRDETEETFKARTGKLFIIQLAYVLVFFGLFTEMGYGATMFRYLSAHNGRAALFQEFTAVGAVLCYVVDARLWTGGKAAAGGVLMAVTAMCLAIGLLFSFQTRQWIPLGFFLLFQPMFHFIIKEAFFQNVHIRHFLRSMTLVTTAVAGVFFSVTLIFFAYNNFWWGQQSRMEFIKRLTDDRTTDDMGYCDATNYTERTAQKLICADGTGECNIHDDCPCDTCPPGTSECYCLAAFLLWSSSLIAAIGLTVFAALFQILSRGMDTEGSPLVSLCAALVFAIIVAWMCGTLMGNAMQAAGAVSGLGLVFGLQVVFVLSRTIGIDAMRQEVMSVVVFRRVVEIGTNSIADWLKAIFMMLLLPAFALALVLSALNQFARKAGLGVAKPPNPAGLLTRPYAGFVDKMRNQWDWTSVLSKMMLIGVVYFVMSVGIAKVSVVFLAWMNEAVEEFSVFEVCMAYLVVGETMFLNPLCPATPVYLTGGVVVVRAMERYLSGCNVKSSALANIKRCQLNTTTMEVNTRDCGVELYLGHNVTMRSCRPMTGHITAKPCTDLSCDVQDVNMLCFCPDLHGSPDWQGNFWTAIAFGACVTFILKMLAIFLEQCAIGMTLGKKLWVRKLVMINTSEMKAIKLILNTDGLNKKKCSILLGGPDWPTSVLTGILRLNVLQMLIGSSPFFFLNTPTVVGGAFQLRTAESDMWATLGAVGFVMTGLTQGSAGAFCFYYIFDVSEKRRAELDQMPDDEEVAAAERIDAQKALLRASVIEWRKLPPWVKLVLVIGAVLQSVWLMLCIFKGKSCWQSLEVSSPISGPPLYAGIDEQGNARDKTVADWFSWIKPWDADCSTYPHATLPICQDYTDDTRPNGYGWVALAIFAAGAVFQQIFSQWAGGQVAAEIKRRTDAGQWPPTQEQMQEQEQQQEQQQQQLQQGVSVSPTAAAGGATEGYYMIPSQMYTPPVVDYSADVAGAKEEEAEDYHKELDVQTTTTV